MTCAGRMLRAAPSKCCAQGGSVPREHSERDEPAVDGLGPRGALHGGKGAGFSVDPSTVPYTVAERSC